RTVQTVVVGCGGTGVSESGGVEVGGGTLVGVGSGVSLGASVGLSVTVGGTPVCGVTPATPPGGNVGRRNGVGVGCPRDPAPSGSSPIISRKPPASAAVTTNRIASPASACCTQLGFTADPPR